MPRGTKKKFNDRVQELLQLKENKNLKIAELKKQIKCYDDNLRTAEIDMLKEFAVSLSDKLKTKGIELLLLDSNKLFNLILDNNSILISEGPGSASVDLDSDKLTDENLKINENDLEGLDPSILEG